MRNLSPGQPENAPSTQAAKRTVFRVLGVLALIVAFGFLAVAGLDLIGAAGSDTSTAQPTKFWMFFVGMPLLFVGSMFLQLGFLSKAPRSSMGA